MAAGGKLFSLLCFGKDFRLFKQKLESYELLPSQSLPFLNTGIQYLVIAMLEVRVFRCIIIQKLFNLRVTAVFAH